MTQTKKPPINPGGFTAVPVTAREKYFGVEMSAHADLFGE